MLSIRDLDEQLVQIFLPKRYSNCVSDEDMAKINSRTIYLNLVYKGMCEKTKSYLLVVDSKCVSQLCKTLCLFFFRYTQLHTLTHMKPNGIPFDGSDSLFQTQQSLVSEMGHAVSLPHFTPTRLEYLQLYIDCYRHSVN